MKKIVWMACGMALMCAPLSASANVRYDDPQEKVQKKEVPNPEKAAQRRTDEMDKALNLTEKQYKQTGDPSEGRSLYWNCPNLWGEQGPGIGATCTVRQGKWKLIYFYETGKKELYDIPADISEKHNLAERYPDVVKSLSANLGEFLRSSGAQRPSFKKTGKPYHWIIRR